jgi:hypothetical protein
MGLDHAETRIVKRRKIKESEAKDHTARELARG